MSLGGKSGPRAHRCMSDTGCRNPVRRPGGIRQDGEDSEAISPGIEWRPAHRYSVFGTAYGDEGHYQPLRLETRTSDILPPIATTANRPTCVSTTRTRPAPGTCGPETVVNLVKKKPRRWTGLCHSFVIASGNQPLSQPSEPLRQSASGVESAPFWKPLTGSVPSKVRPDAETFVTSVV